MEIEQKMKINKQEMGRKARQSGGIFERRVRADLEMKEWIVCKWNNQVDFEKNKIISAPAKFNFFTKTRSQAQGFPDFIAYKIEMKTWSIIGVEAKSAKYLDKEEKKKCQWMLDNHIFDQILIAYKDKQGHVDYYEYTGEKNETTKEESENTK